MKKIKLSELPASTSLQGLYTLGTDTANNRSVRVPLSGIQQAVDNANSVSAAASAALARKQDKLSTDGNFTLTANNQLLLNHAAKRAVFNWLWGEVGGSYDAAIDDGWSGNVKCYTINGVWMTFNQAMKAYRLGICRGGEGEYGAENIVTNLPRTSLIVTQNNFLQHCPFMTVANIKMINLGAGAFVGCHALERIVSLNHDGSYVDNADLGRTAVSLNLSDRTQLTEVKIRLVNTTPITLDISGAPNVTKESLEWMLEKAQLAHCSADTIIKLHSEVYNKYGAELMNKQTAPGASYQHRIQFSS